MNESGHHEPSGAGPFESTSTSSDAMVLAQTNTAAGFQQRGHALRDTASTPASASDAPEQPLLSKQLIVQQQDDSGLGHGVIYGKTMAGFSEHAAGVMKLLHGLWENRHLCDMVIHVAGQTLPVHRLALAACSEMFKAKLCSQRPDEIKELFVSGSSVEGAELVLGYIYTLELSLDDDIVEPVLSCALQLGVTTVVEACKAYLSRFTLDNAVRFIEIAERHQLLDVLAKIHGFICSNFLDIAGSAEFLGYDPDTLSRLLADDNLVVVSELDVYLAAQRWIEHNIEERVHFAPDLMKLVRLVLISPEDIALHVETCQYIFQIPECHDMLYTALRFHALKYSNSYLAQTFQLPKPRRIKTLKLSAAGHPSKATAKHENKSFNCAYGNANLAQSGAVPANQRAVSSCMIFTVGGLNPAEPSASRASRLVNEYDPSTNSWVPLTNLPDRRHHQGMVLLNKELYVIGGGTVEQKDTEQTRHQNPTNTCYKFDLASHTWYPLPAMRSKRVYHSVVCLDGNIYVLGGQDELGKCLNTVECFEPASNKWLMLPAMSEAKKWATAVTFRGLIYVIGGFRETTSTKRPLSIVECYEPVRRCWLKRQPFPTPCSHACAVVACDTLFVIGGATCHDMEGPISSLASVYIYLPDQDDWQFFTNLHVSRHSAAAVSIGSQIYVMGGLATADNQVLASIECLDIVNGSWVNDIADLPHPVLGLCACVDNDDDEI